MLRTALRLTVQRNILIVGEPGGGDSQLWSWSGRQAAELGCACGSDRGVREG